MATDIFYVYQLRRADSALPFYIGKGKGNRCFSHFKKADGSGGNRLKNRAIMKARQDGVEILAEKLVENIDEELAFLCEVELINKYGGDLQGPEY